MPCLVVLYYILYSQKKDVFIITQRSETGNLRTAHCCETKYGNVLGVRSSRLTIPLESRTCIHCQFHDSYFKDIEGEDGVHTVQRQWLLLLHVRLCGFDSYRSVLFICHCINPSEDVESG